MNKIKKTIYVVNVNDYAPELRKLTYPLIGVYARKIGADVCEINKRKWPDAPPVYEKLQIYELAKKNKSDWNIYIDSDAIVHPDLPDITNHLSKDTVMHNGNDMASNRWRYDEYFLRDGRNIGSCNWFTVASDWCLDLWKPLEDITINEAVQNIFPIEGEKIVGITREHLIDDYTLSRNIAKHGLKFTTWIDVLAKIGQPNYNYLWHEYQIKEDEKYRKMCKIILEWQLLNNYQDPKLVEEILSVGKKQIDKEKFDANKTK